MRAISLEEKPNCICPKIKRGMVSTSLLSLPTTKKAEKYDDLEREILKYEWNMIPKVSWLDDITFNHVDLLRNKEIKKSSNSYLTVVFPMFTQEIKYFEKPLNESLDPEKRKPKKKTKIYAEEEYITELVLDPTHNNPVENKMWALDDGKNFIDFEGKPNPSDKIKLDAILRIPPNEELTEEEKQLCWKYQYFLSKRPEALAKFLHSVNWNNEEQVSHSLFMLYKWERPSSWQALEYLQDHHDFSHLKVRRFACECMREFSIKNLKTCMFSLVQALRNEFKMKDSPLFNFLMKKKHRKRRNKFSFQMVSQHREN
eukprot:TRINITY_DN8360_c0_g1_i1.p1 TRINITY_DN8360_c0_g1~~TRINITY_DN8360_c0_g1_i1.p1  ORF type:complete len:314 (-),score=89.48 TRINITY_DN8360_c0_g1_i1:836-1777(-)